MQLSQQSINTFFLKKYFYIPFLGIFLGIAISYFLIYSEQQEGAVYLLKYGVLASILGVIIVFVIFRTTQILNRFLPYKNKTGNRLFAGFSIHFTISFLISVGGFYLYLIPFFKATHFLKVHNAVLLKLGIVLLVLTIIFEVIYFALYSYYAYSKLQIETVKQERKQIELQLKALKSQLSPHFLFNSLNTISSLMYKDGNKAENFIRRLAKLYDFTLKSYHQKLISLEQELDFVNAYIFLLETRFKDSFSCKITIDDNLLMRKIPPLTLQLLIENAVKHNQLSIVNPLEVQIKSTEKELIIENNITTPSKNITSFNIGLKNINTRYVLLINKTISVSKSKNFTVKIPLIE
jgi:sensor histidine kinase YesM